MTLDYTHEDREAIDRFKAEYLKDPKSARRELDEVKAETALHLLEVSNKSHFDKMQKQTTTMPDKQA